MSQQTKFLISLVTVVYNDKLALEKTLKATKEILIENLSVEHIIIDAVSTDGSTNVAQKYAKEVTHCKLIVEKDKGIYDALNKATDCADGSLIMLLHCGDVPGKDFKSVLANGIEEPQKLHAFNYELEGTNVHEVVKRPFIERFSTAIKHPALLIPKSLLSSVGGYSLDYRISADVYAIHKIIKEKFNSDYTKGVVYHSESLIRMAPFGFSADKRHFLEKKKEHFKIFFVLRGFSVSYALFCLVIVKAIIINSISRAVGRV